MRSLTIVLLILGVVGHNVAGGSHVNVPKLPLGHGVDAKSPSPSPRPSPYQQPKFSPRWILDGDAKDRNPILQIVSRRQLSTGIPCIDIRTIGFHPSEAKILTKDMEKSRKMIARTIQYVSSPQSHDQNGLFHMFFPKDSQSYVIGVYESILKQMKQPVTVLKSRDAEHVVASALKHDKANKISVNGQGSYFRLSPRSRAGAICHEVSHIVGTEDVTIEHAGEMYAAYGELACRLLKERQVFDALNNADSYNCFAKSVDEAIKNGTITLTEKKQKPMKGQQLKRNTKSEDKKAKYFIKQVIPQQKGTPRVIESDYQFSLFEE